MRVCLYIYCLFSVEFLHFSFYFLYCLGFGSGFFEGNSAYFIVLYFLFGSMDFWLQGAGDGRKDGQNEDTKKNVRCFLG